MKKREFVRIIFLALLCSALILLFSMATLRPVEAKEPETVRYFTSIRAGGGGCEQDPGVIFSLGAVTDADLIKAGRLPGTVQNLEPYPLTAWERDWVEKVVMAEAGNQSFEGMMLVAQCIRNTAEDKRIRPYDVITEPGQYAGPCRYASGDVKRAVSDVFDRGMRVTSEPVMYFYNPKLTRSRWHETKLIYVLTCGDHRFFKVQGGAG